MANNDTIRRGGAAAYQELAKLLASGREAVLVTELPEGGEAKKTLHAVEPGEGAALLASIGAEGLAPGSLVLRREGRPPMVVERLSPKPRLLVLGGGHIAQALVPMAAALDLAPVVYDDRPFFADKARFPAAELTICESFSDLAAKLPARPGDWVVIATRGHKRDQECLEALLHGPEPQYLGMIGSKRRVAIVKRALAAAGADPGRLARLRSPIGLPIGAVTPAEIAVSILAEMIAVRCEARAASGRGRIEERLDDALLSWLSEGRARETAPAAMITVVSASGSTPRRPGAKMAALLDGRTIGSVGGGCAEASVIEAARQMGPGAPPAFLMVDMGDTAEDDGMVCGGRMEVLIEPLA